MKLRKEIYDGFKLCLNFPYLQRSFIFGNSIIVNCFFLWKKILVLWRNIFATTCLLQSTVSLAAKKFLWMQQFTTKENCCLNVSCDSQPCWGRAIIMGLLPDLIFFSFREIKNCLLPIVSRSTQLIVRRIMWPQRPPSVAKSCCRSLGTKKKRSANSCRL